jgi:hypothetical protein
VKYLEVILDEKLDWKAHLENRMRKACIAYWQHRRGVGKTWRLELGNCLSSVKNVAEKTKSRLDEILTEAA